MGTERRKSERFRLANIVQVTFTCDGKTMGGRLFDISRLGMSIEYAGPDCVDVGKALDITIVGDSIGNAIVEKIACRPVYDIPTLAHNQSFRGQEMRLCGLAYAGLSQKNHAKLSQLMESAAAN
jgi:hypothetical protein